MDNVIFVMITHTNVLDHSLVLPRHMKNYMVYMFLYGDSVNIPSIYQLAYFSNEASCCDGNSNYLLSPCNYRPDFFRLMNKSEFMIITV